MIKAIIIDDQESWRKKLLKMINANLSRRLEIMGEAESMEDGIDLIKKLNPELVFLDIEMPGGSGFDLLEKFEEINFKVIFTTSFDQFAIRAIKFSALDYLLKPVKANELIKAVEKVEKEKEKKKSDNTKQFEVLINNLKNASDNIRNVALPTQEGLVFKKLNDIVKCRADGNYSVFFMTDNSKIMVSKTLKDSEALLCDLFFLRIHDSCIINLNHIKKYIKGEGGFACMVDGSEEPVARRKKEEFKNRLDDLGLTF